VQNSSWLVLPAILFLLVFFIIPLVRIFQLSIFDPGFTLKYYAEYLGVSAYPLVTLNTIRLAFTVTAACLVLGYPVAYAVNTASPRLKRMLIATIMLPYLTSLMVRTYAWMVLLDRTGLVNQAFGVFGLGPFRLLHNAFGVYVGMVHVLLPLMILPLMNAMANIDMRVVRAAESLGATPLQAFRRIFLPLSMPGVVAGSCLVFIIGLGFFVTPALLGGLQDSTVSVIIQNQVGVALNWQFASALAVVLLAATLLTLAAAMLLLRLIGRWIGIGRVNVLGMSL
jgi:ABC-type spermidine/putrescine transport system permease subunit I